MGIFFTLVPCEKNEGMVIIQANQFNVPLKDEEILKKIERKKFEEEGFDAIEKFVSSKIEKGHIRKEGKYNFFWENELLFAAEVTFLNKDKYPKEMQPYLEKLPEYKSGGYRVGGRSYYAFPYFDDTTKNLSINLIKSKKQSR